MVAVPKDVDDDALRKVATFRHSGRFPVLSYYHKKNGMVSAWETFSKTFFVSWNCNLIWHFYKDLLLSGSNVYLYHCCSQVMMRAGQPLTGTNGRRCKEDEKLINATLRPGKRGYIIDTRTIGVAQQAKARGGGFESEANYPQWRRIHKAVERWVVPEGLHWLLKIIANQCQWLLQGTVVSTFVFLCSLWTECDSFAMCLYIANKALYCSKLCNHLLQKLPLLRGGGDVYVVFWLVWYVFTV